MDKELANKTSTVEPKTLFNKQPDRIAISLPLSNYAEIIHKTQALLKKNNA